MRLDELPDFFRAYSTREFYINVQSERWVGNPIPGVVGEVCFWDFQTNAHGSLFFFKEALRRQGPVGFDLTSLDSRIPMMFRELKPEVGKVDVGVLDVHRLPLTAHEAYVWEVLKGAVYELTLCV